MKRAGIPHKVLNAKNHEQEAEIVAQAGRIGAVTISTNMAGRGTDIILGGNPDFLVKERLRKEGLSPEMVSAASEKVPSENLANSLGISVDELKELQSRYEEMLREAKKELEVEHQKVVELGGLHIIGTERHESRRIDNQLRGRAGRQGDPGSSRFYISLEDELMRRFGGDRALGLLEKLGWTEDMPIEHDAISRQIESAQKRVEAWNFNIRKNVLEYDQVLNRQREAIYSLRRGFLLGGQSRQTIDSMIENTVKNLVEYATVDTEQVAQWPWDSILSSFRELIGTYDQGVRDLAAKLQQSHKNSSTRDALEDIVQQFTDEVKKAMAQREEEIGKALFQEISRVVTLRNVDQAWMDHLDNMDDLKEGIGLRAYGQMNPLIEYQKESSRLFEATLMRIEEETIRLLFHLRLANEEEVKRAEAREKAKLSALQSNRNAAEAQAAPVQAKKEPGRNDPCPCGSGKKYKKCCGK